LNSPEFDFRFNWGIGETPSAIRVTDKNKIVNVMTLHCTILATIALVKRSLTNEKFDELMKKHPESFLVV